MYCIGMSCEWCNHFLLAVSSKFIQSKPTGSRMVTADLNIFLNKTMISASWVLTNVVIIRIIFGPMNYWLVLFCIGILQVIHTYAYFDCFSKSPLTTFSSMQTRIIWKGPLQINYGFLLKNDSLLHSLQIYMGQDVNSFLFELNF